MPVNSRFLCPTSGYPACHQLLVPGDAFRSRNAWRGCLSVTPAPAGVVAGPGTYPLLQYGACTHGSRGRLPAPGYTVILPLAETAASAPRAVPGITPWAQTRSWAWVTHLCATTLLRVVTVLRGFLTGSLGTEGAETGNNRIAAGQSGPYTGLCWIVVEEAGFLTFTRARVTNTDKSPLLSLLPACALPACKRTKKHDLRPESHPREEEYWREDGKEREERVRS